MKKLTLLGASLLITLTAFCQQKKESSPVFNGTGKSIKVYTTADNTNLRISLTDELKFSNAAQPLEVETSVFVNPNKSFQSIIGIGGALTDASAETFAKLSKAKQQEFLTAYYDKEKGIGYSLARTNIHSCDFSSDSYTYITEGDKDLKTFSIVHDLKFKIPFIKQVIQAAGGKLQLFASPWTPPAFMKDNKDMLHGGKLLPEFYQPWANYYTKFIKSYEKEGIPVWGITVQNEPMAIQTWESCKYTAEEERDFLKNFLGPTMVKEGLGDKKIIVWDHNRDLMTYRANVIFDDPEAAKYAWGMGFHWYETWTGGAPLFDNVRNVYESYPSKNLLFTEGCIERFSAAQYTSWPNAERYGSSLIHDFNNGMNGFTDWNILLDEQGGPNHVGNFCMSPVHADTKTGELIFTPEFYYIGHFSKFVRPNAKRISSSTSTNNLYSASFVNADGKMVTVVMNHTNNQINYNLIIGNFKTEVAIKPHSIQTLVY